MAHTVTLPHGHLPTLSFFVSHSGLPAAEARETLTEMRRLLRKHGPTQAIRDALLLCGFAWHAAPALPDAGLQEAVDSVAAAIGEER